MNTIIIKVHCQNKPFTGNIYNKIHKTRRTQRKHFVKCVNVSNLTYIQLLLPLDQHTQYLQLTTHIITESLIQEIVFLMMILFYFRCHDAEEALVFHMGLFCVIVNLFTHLELLMYAKPTSFLVGSTNLYGMNFYQV